MRVVMTNKILDLFDQFFDALEGSPSNCLLGDDVEPDFDLIEP